VTRDGDGGPSEAAGPEAKAAFAFAKCMRDHGISDWPDPVVGDHDISLGGDRVPPSAKVAAARAACQHILDESGPSGGPSGGGPADTAAAAWQKVTPGGGCECADGSPYSLYTRTADLKKVVLFLDGGGACWSAATCAPGGSNRYQTTADPPNAEGVFAAGDRRNPLAGYSFVYAPYCTADVFLGDTTTTYGPGVTVHHKGYVDGTAALDHLVKTFPDATDVVVLGVSAGSVSAPLYAGLVADRLPGAHVTAIADSSGGYPDGPAVNQLFSAWHVPGVGPGWSLPGLFILSGRRHPGVVFARVDHAGDADQKAHLALLGVPTNDLAGLMRANETQIERAGVTLHSYTAPGEGHVVLDDSNLYTETVDGTALVDWIAALLSGRPAADVS
jgi:hypothetical protein